MRIRDGVVFGEERQNALACHGLEGPNVATDLVPEVNREPGIRMALVFFAGVGAFLLLRALLPAL